MNITTKGEYMSSSLMCPNCGDYLGKASENLKYVYCGNCCEHNIKKGSC